MTNKYQKLFQTLEKEREGLMDQVNGWQTGLANTQPGEDEWSAAQVFHHLILAESGTVRYIQKKLQGLDQLPNVSIENQMNFQRLSMRLRSPEKFRAPEILSTPENKQLSTLISEWNEVRNGWATLLEEMPEAAAKKEIFKHPYIGYLNPVQSLGFTRDHLQHHLRQINRIKKQIS